MRRKNRHKITQHILVLPSLSRCPPLRNITGLMYRAEASEVGIRAEASEVGIRAEASEVGIRAEASEVGIRDNLQ